jgi:hypothetical protein
MSLSGYPAIFEMLSLIGTVLCFVFGMEFIAINHIKVVYG